MRLDKRQNNFPISQYQLLYQEQVLKVGSKKIKLRNKLWMVLSHLVENKNLLVTKAELVNSYWSGDLKKGDAAVTNAICQIRKILDCHLRNCSIITIAKQGYIFSDYTE